MKIEIARIESESSRIIVFIVCFLLIERSIIEISKAVGLAFAFAVDSYAIAFPTATFQEAKYVLGYQTLELLIS